MDWYENPGKKKKPPKPKKVPHRLIENALVVPPKVLGQIARKREFGAIPRGVCVSPAKIKEALHALYPRWPQREKDLVTWLDKKRSTTRVCVLSQNLTKEERQFVQLHETTHTIIDELIQDPQHNNVLTGMVNRHKRSTPRIAEATAAYAQDRLNAQYELYELVVEFIADTVALAILEEEGRLERILDADAVNPFVRHIYTHGGAIAFGNQVRDYLDEHWTYDEEVQQNPPEFYDILWERNDGIFYRGAGADPGKGSGLGAIGRGLYLAWDEGMAGAYARAQAEPYIYEYQLPEGLNLLDESSVEMADIKAMMGFQPWAYSDDPMYARALTVEVKELGYDGVASSDRATGLVIFDPSVATLIERRYLDPSPRRGSLKKNPPDAQQRAFLKNRCAELVAEEPRMQELIDTLLALGGDAVVCVYEEDLGVLLDGAHGLPPADVQDYLVIEDAMEPSQCHQNVATLFLSDAINAIATGWTLTDDGLWRQHSWGIVDVDGVPAIIETTMKRDIYWGVRLTRKISEAVAYNFLGY